MKFELRHRFPRPARVVWQTLLSAAYEEAVQVESRIGKKVLEDVVIGGVRRRRTQVTPEAELPAMAQKVIGATRLAYEYIEEIDEAAMSVKWRVKPERHGDKVDASGSYRFVEAPGGCERILGGDVNVRVPLVGGRIESIVSDELKAGYDKAHAFAVRWLQERA